MWPQRLHQGYVGNVENCYRPRWSNFCTLVGHFSKLFEFAGLGRLKASIFVFSSQNKRSSFGIGLNPRLSSISSPCLVTQGCRCL